MEQRNNSLRCSCFIQQKKERKKLQQYFSHVIVMYSAAHEIAHRQANLEEPHPPPTPFIAAAHADAQVPLREKINKYKITAVSNRSQLPTRSLGLIGCLWWSCITAHFHKKKKKAHQSRCNPLQVKWAGGGGKSDAAEAEKKGKRKKWKKMQGTIHVASAVRCWKVDGCNTHMTWTEAPAWRELRRIVRIFFYFIFCIENRLRCFPRCLHLPTTLPSLEEAASDVSNWN